MLGSVAVLYLELRVRVRVAVLYLELRVRVAVLHLELRWRPSRAAIPPRPSEVCGESVATS